MTTAISRSARADQLTILPLLLALTAAWAAASAYGWRGLVAGAALVVAGAAAHRDLLSHRIPDRVLLLAASPLSVSVVLDHGRAVAVATLALGAVVMAGPLLVLHLASPAAMGWGDVKLACLLGAALAVVDPRLGIPALVLASAATLAVAVATRRAVLPFAPGLVGGAAVALTVASTNVLELAR
jgi:leader peptidase (prepilin peptidase)/N-methyltransferase